MIADIIAVLVAVGFAYAVARHVRYVPPMERFIREHYPLKRDVGPASSHGSRHMLALGDRIDRARRLGYRPPEWPYAATTRAALDRQRERAEEAGRRQPTDHPRDDEGRLR